jgi:hypothetical protein
VIDQAIAMDAPIRFTCEPGSHSNMSAKQDLPSNRRFEARAAFPWLVAAGLVLGTAGAARADEPAPPAPAEGAPATPEPAASEAPAPKADMPAAAPEPPAPKNYVTAVIGTTPFYRPNGGPVADYIKDVNPAIGYGRYVTPTVALELDAGLTYISGADLVYFLVPGVVWSFSTHVYAAARLVLPVHPDVKVVLYPGIGGFYGFDNGLGFSLELNPAVTVVNGDPDFGLAVNLGVVYAF